MSNERAKFERKQILDILTEKVKLSLLCVRVFRLFKPPRWRITRRLTNVRIFSFNNPANNNILKFV